MASASASKVRFAKVLYFTSLYITLHSPDPHWLTQLWQERNTGGGGGVLEGEKLINCEFASLGVIL